MTPLPHPWRRTEDHRVVPGNLALHGEGPGHLHPAANTHDEKHACVGIAHGLNASFDGIVLRLEFGADTKSPHRLTRGKQKPTGGLPLAPIGRDLLYRRRDDTTFLPQTLP